MSRLIDTLDLTHYNQFLIDIIHTIPFIFFNTQYISHYNNGHLHVTKTAIQTLISICNSGDNTPVSRIRDGGYNQ